MSGLLEQEMSEAAVGEWKLGGTFSVSTVMSRRPRGQRGERAALGETGQL
jgi:hypothetical protein